jgi:electron transfer flavoprotein beta subunit
VSTPRTPTIGVLLKRVDLRLSVDPLTGAVEPDPHGGMSASDECALELALRMAEATGATVLAATAGPASSEAVLVDALEAGATDAVRVVMPLDADSAEVARALAGVVGQCQWVWCGDFSLDRGSGSVPAFVAATLGAAQALGIAAIHFPMHSAAPDSALDAEPRFDGFDAEPRFDGFEVERRLDGGRREVLHVSAPAVLSVESGIAELRRPGISAVLGARAVPIRVVPSGARPHAGGDTRTRPFRPRPRVLEGPDPSLSPRDRMVILSGALTDRDPPRIVHPRDADEAADELLAFLRARGYFDDGVASPGNPSPGNPSHGNAD